MCAAEFNINMQCSQIQRSWTVLPAHLVNSRHSKSSSLWTVGICGTSAPLGSLLMFAPAFLGLKNHPTLNLSVTDQVDVQNLSNSSSSPLVLAIHQGWQNSKPCPRILTKEYYQGTNPNMGMSWTFINPSCTHTHTSWQAYQNLSNIFMGMPSFSLFQILIFPAACRSMPQTDRNGRLPKGKCKRLHWLTHLAMTQSSHGKCG